MSLVIREESAGCFEWLFLFLLFGFVSVFLLILAAICFGLYLGGRLFYREILLPKLRLFNAPPMSRWSEFYEHYLFELGEITGIAFNTSPSGLAMGAIIISLAPAVVGGIPLLILSPSLGVTWLLGFGVLGIVIGLATGSVLARPETFYEPSEEKSIEGADSDGGFVLGSDFEW